MPESEFDVSKFLKYQNADFVNNITLLIAFIKTLGYTEPSAFLIIIYTRKSHSMRIRVCRAVLQLPFRYLVTSSTSFSTFKTIAKLGCNYQNLTTSVKSAVFELFKLSFPIAKEIILIDAFPIFHKFILLSAPLAHSPNNIWKGFSHLQ